MRGAQHVDGETICILACGSHQGEASDRSRLASKAGAVWRRFTRLVCHLREKGGQSRASSLEEMWYRRPAGTTDGFGKAMHQAQKMALVGQMASGIAHDFNNALQVAMLALDLGEKRLKQHGPAECQPLLREAHASLQRASALSRRLLNLASPNQDRAKRIDLNEVVGGMQNVLRSALGGAISLSLVLDEHALQIVCDAHDLENAVLNLAINARDAMLAGGRLTISTYRADLLAQRAGLACGPYVGLDIADTGCGMEARVAELAFEAFFTTKPPGQGTGLGLAMVKSFVAGHQGHLDVTSAPERGTTIRIYLPAFA